LIGSSYPKELVNVEIALLPAKCALAQLTLTASNAVMVTSLKMESANQDALKDCTSLKANANPAWEDAQFALTLTNVLLLLHPRL
jgi:hypothetical protein